MKQFLKKIVTGLLWERVHVRVFREKPLVIAVTGSVGKTSTKDAIALVLEQTKKPIVKTTGGMNSDIGVPMSLSGFTETPSSAGAWFSLLLRTLLRPPRIHVTKGSYYVLEYSADKPGDIAYLTSKLPPEVAVLTRIVPVHMQAYSSLDALAEEKFSLVKGLRKGGLAILNADDPLQRARAKNVSSVIWYGMGDKSRHTPGIWGHSTALTEKGLRFQIDFVVAKKMDSIAKQQTHSITVQTGLLGEHQLYNLLVAAALGFRLGVSFDSIRTGLEAYQVPPGRGRLIPGKRNITIIDDSYNASPESIKSGLDMLKPYAKKRRVVAILGNMNEFGDKAEAAHIEVARYAPGKVDYLILAGPFASLMAKEAEAAGLASHQVIAFQTPEQLLDKLDQLVQRGDVVYIKGSQNKVRLERAVKLLMEHPEQAEQLLARQSSFWTKNL